eukprot:jgi/Picre1/31249/NNA_006603.t1
MMEQRVPGTVRLALHCNCDFYKEKGCWRYNQKFCVETEMSTDITYSDLNLRLMDTIAPVAGYKGKITSVSSRLPGKRFNGNPIHLKKIETEDDLAYLLQTCKHSCIVNKDMYKVDVFVAFEPLNIEEEFGEDVAQFLVKLSDDKVYQEEVLAGLEELSQEEWNDDMLQLDVFSDELASETCIEQCPAEMPESDISAISPEKIGAYRPASAAADEPIDESINGQENNNVPCDIVSEKADPDSFHQHGTTKDNGPCVAASEGQTKASVFDTASEEKPRLRRFAKKMGRSKRALSKFFGLFSCLGAPSCLA